MSNFDAAIAGFSEIKKKMAEAIKDATAPARMALLADFKAVFDKHPDVKSIKWKQYTPYFNDGDACTFSVHEAYVFTGANNEDSWEGSWNHEARKDLPKIDRDAVEEIMLAMFGDHVEVVLKRDAADFEVEEYSHD